MQIGANADRAKALSLKILSLKRFSLPAPVSDIGIRSSGENCPEGSNTGFGRQCYFLRQIFLRQIFLRQIFLRQVFFRYVFFRYVFFRQVFYARFFTLGFLRQFFYASFFTLRFSAPRFCPMFLRLIFCYAMVWCFWCYVSHFYFFGSFVACDQSLTSRHCYRGFEKSRALGDNRYFPNNSYPVLSAPV